MAIPTKPRSASERRESFRTQTWIRLRIRPAEEVARPSVLDSDLLPQFEGLVGTAAAFRTEIGPYGGLFVDKLLALTDAMIGELERMAAGSETEWLSFGNVEADLSVGGIGFSMTDPPASGTRVELFFRLPDAVTAIPFRLRGTVMHARAGVTDTLWVGVRFDEVPDPVRTRLGRAVLDLQRMLLREYHNR